MTSSQCSQKCCLKCLLKNFQKEQNSLTLVRLCVNLGSFRPKSQQILNPLDCGLQAPIKDCDSLSPPSLS